MIVFFPCLHDLFPITSECEAAAFCEVNSTLEEAGAGSFPDSHFLLFAKCSEKLLPNYFRLHFTFEDFVSEYSINPFQQDY